MDKLKLYTNITSIFLILIGLVFLVLEIFLGKKVSVALPMVFLMLGGADYLLTFVFMRMWKWAVWLFIPGSILLALGVVFFFNVVTNDWNSWSYAWLLVVAGIGQGLVLASRQGGWREEYSLIGAGLIVLGITFFVVFGMIAGGTVIRISAPVLIVLGGLSLRWVKLEKILPKSLLQRFSPAAPIPKKDSSSQTQITLQEPLSTREIEVLRLIDQGFTNQEIAVKLTVAPSTIKTHINNIYGKLGVQTRIQALNRARDLGLLSS
jgi:DNA-binding CsgD family transcriptional regulator